MTVEQIKRSLELIENQYKDLSPERVNEICDNNPYQQIGFYRGLIESIQIDLAVLKERIDESEGIS